MGKARQIYCFGKRNVFRLDLVSPGRSSFTWKYGLEDVWEETKITFGPFPAQECVLLMQFLYKSLLTSNQPETLIFFPLLLLEHCLSQHTWTVRIHASFDTFVAHRKHFAIHGCHKLIIVICDSLSHEISRKPQFGCSERCKKVFIFIFLTAVPVDSLGIYMETAVKF